MAHYPLITGNNHTTANSVAASTFDLDNNAVEEGFDVYTFQNTNDSVQAAYAVIVVKNTGAAGSLLNISEIKLERQTSFVLLSTVTGNSTIGSFKMNPENNAGKVFMGKPQNLATGTNVLANPVALPKFGVSSDNTAHAANMFLHLTADANIDSTQINNTQLGQTGRTIPIYKIDSLLANSIPANSYGAFILQYNPTVVETQNSSTLIKITSNTGAHTINIQSESFNNVVLNAKLGSLSGQVFTTEQTAVDTGTLDLGYYGTAKTNTLFRAHVGQTKSVIEVSDVSTQVGGDFAWTTSEVSASSGSLSLGGDTAVAVSSDLSKHNIGQNFVGGNASGWMKISDVTDIDSVEEGSYTLTSDSSDFDVNNTNISLYKNVDYTHLNTGFFNGTKNLIDTNTQARGLNYILNEFAIGQVYGLQFNSDSFAYTTAQKNFMFKLKAGIYERMTIPSTQSQKVAGYNRKSTGNGATPPNLDSQDSVALNESTINLIINVRWNNWARATSGEDNGSEITFTTGGKSGVFNLTNTDLFSSSVEPSKFAITSANDGSGSFVTGSFAAFGFSNADTKDVALHYDCNISLTTSKLWGGAYDNSKITSEYLNDWGVAKSSFTMDSNDGIGWNIDGDYPHITLPSANFYTLKHQLRPSYPDLTPQSQGFNTAFPSSIYTQLSNVPNTTSGATSVMDGTINKFPVTSWYNASNATINNTTGSFPLSTAMGVRTMYSGHRGGVYVNENVTVQASGSSTSAGWSALADTIGRATNSISTSTNLSYPETHIQASSTLDSGNAAAADHITGNTDYVTVGMKVYLTNESGAYLGKVSAITNSTAFKIDTAILVANQGPNKTLYFKGNKSYNTYTPYIKKADNSQLRDFVPNNNIYKMLNAVAAVDGSGKYVSFGRVLLTNPGDSILYLHSIETGTNSGMYDYNINGLTNNSSADLGYKPNTNANDPVLLVSIQGVDGNVHGTGGTPSFNTKYSFYTENAASTSTVGDSNRWYSDNPTTYYKNLGRQNAVAVHSLLVHKYTGESTVNNFENLAKDNQAGYGAGALNFTPNSSSGLIERLDKDPALETDSLTTITGLTLVGGAKVNPTLNIKMEIPFATSSANSFGNYQSWMRIVFMPADYYNHRYYNTTNDAFEVLTPSAYNSNGIRLYESIYLFKTSVANNAQIITADAEGDAVSSGQTINFGNISIG